VSGTDGAGGPVDIGEATGGTWEDTWAAGAAEIVFTAEFPEPELTVEVGALLIPGVATLGALWEAAVAAC